MHSSGRTRTFLSSAKVVDIKMYRYFYNGLYFAGIVFIQVMMASISFSQEAERPPCYEREPLTIYSMYVVDPDAIEYVRAFGIDNYLNQFLFETKIKLNEEFNNRLNFDPSDNPEVKQVLDLLAVEISEGEESRFGWANIGVDQISSYLVGVYDVINGSRRRFRAQLYCHKIGDRPRQLALASINLNSLDEDVGDSFDLAAPILAKRLWLSAGPMLYSDYRSINTPIWPLTPAPLVPLEIHDKLPAVIHVGVDSRPPPRGSTILGLDPKQVALISAVTFGIGWGISDMSKNAKSDVVRSERLDRYDWGDVGVVLQAVGAVGLGVSVVIALRPTDR